MDKIVPAPSLSASGWITNIVEKTDTLVAHFFAAEKSQNGSYVDEAVTSLAWIIQEYGHDPLSCATQLQRRIEGYLGRYFETANVLAEIDNTAEQEATGRTNIRLTMTVTQLGKEYSVASLVETANNKVVNIIKLNNGA